MTETTTDPLFDRVARYVDALDDATDQANVTDAVALARQLVTDKIGTRTVPEPVRDSAIVEVAADQYHRRTAHNGIAAVDSVDVQPFRINRDPLIAAYPILRPYLGLGIA